MSQDPKTSSKDLLIDISVDDDLTNALDMRGNVLVGLIIPATITSTTITFLGSIDNGTFTAMYNTAGTALSAAVLASRLIAINPSDFASVDYLKIATGSNEIADRTITAIMRNVQ